MNEKIKQEIYYMLILLAFVCAFCYFGTSHIDRRRSEDIGARIDDSQNINSELQTGTGKLQQATNDSQREVEDAIRGLGNAEKELDRATSSIERCQQILGDAQRRAQKTDKADK